MDNTWFVELQGRPFGPLTGMQLKGMAAGGQIQPTTLLRQATSENWTVAQNVPGLFTANAWIPLPGVPTPTTLGMPPAGGLSGPLLPAYAVPSPAANNGADPLEFVEEFVPHHAASAKLAAHLPDAGHLSPLAATAHHAHVKTHTRTQLNIALGVLAGAIALLAILTIGGVFNRGPQQMLEDEVRFVNKQLPQRLDDTTRLDRLIAGPHLTCTLVYVITKNIAAEVQPETQARISQELRQHPFLQKIFALHATVRLRYVNPSGRTLSEFGI